MYGSISDSSVLGAALQSAIARARLSRAPDLHDPREKTRTRDRGRVYPGLPSAAHDPTCAVAIANDHPRPRTARAVGSRLEQRRDESAARTGARLARDATTTLADPHPKGVRVTQTRRHGPGREGACFLTSRALPAGCAAAVGAAVSGRATYVDGAHRMRAHRRAEHGSLGP